MPSRPARKMTTWNPRPCQITTAATETSAWRGLCRNGWISKLSQVRPSAAAQSSSWMYNVNNGIFNAFIIQLDDWAAALGLTWLSFEIQPFLQSPRQALVSVAAVVIWQGLGFQVVIFLAGLLGI